MEIVGVDRGAHPFAGIGIGRNRLLAAADLVLGLGGGVLHPLVILDAAAQPDGVGHRDAVVGIGEGLIGLGKGGGVDQLAVKGGIHTGDIRDVHTFSGGGLKHFCRFDCAAFVPPQQNGRENEQQQAGTDPLQGAAQAAAIAGFSYFLVGHTLLKFNTSVRRKFLR